MDKPLCANNRRNNIISLSDIFNIKEIKVLNNSKISTQDIKNLSGLQVNQNMFKFLEISVGKKIKQNPYIQDVRIRRKLNRYNRN